MSDRPYWFECFSLGRDLRDCFGDHFRHLLDGDRRFFLRNRTCWFECSFLVACSRSAKESSGGANVCARPILEMIRSVAIVTLRQASLRTSASYAANPHSRQEIFLNF